MKTRIQKGILSEISNPRTDADVIITAAVIGHSYQRISSGKNCNYEYEEELSNKTEGQIKFQKKVEEHRKVVNNINGALLNGGLKLNTRKVTFGTSPTYGKNGNRVVIGGTGNLEIDDLKRYYPKNPEGLAKILYQEAINDVEGKLGYQGQGAYTGFIDRRGMPGQSSLMTTYRFRAPDVFGPRWIPSSDAIKDLNEASLGDADNEKKAWGMTSINSNQEKLVEKGMYMKDDVNESDVVGYVHGMIQAIYNIKMHEKPTDIAKAIPYEIAVGKETTKLSSCVACSFFMEANGYPASSTHLGRSDSWCIVHHNESSHIQNEAHKTCNASWAAYCKKIIRTGLYCLSPDLSRAIVNETHLPSLKLLKALDKNQESDFYANLILDALTINGKIYQLLNRTIKNSRRTN